MADDLEDVTERFTADTAEYTANLDEASVTAQEFAIANEEAKVAVDGIRDSAAEAAAAVAGAGAAAAEAADGDGHLRDAAIEAGAALGHVRDDALEASVSVKELGTQAEETAAKLDLMGLAGASSYTSLGPLVGLIGAAVVAGAAAAPAFAAMTLGISAFGLFAIPTLSAVSGGYQQITKDQQAVDAATTAAAKSTALAKLQHDWAQLPAPIAQAVKEVMSFKAEFTSLAKSSGIQSSVLGDLTKGLQIVEQLLPKIVPLAQAGAKAVSGIISVLGVALQSSPFMQFLSLMTQMVGPATQAITQLAMTLAGVLGSALETLLGDSVPFIRFVTVLVQALSGPLITALHFVIDLFLGLATALEPLLPGLSQIAQALVVDIGSSFEAFIPLISKVVAILGGAFLKILQDLLPVIANALTPNSPFMLALNQLPAALNAIMPLITGFASILANPAIAQAAVWILSLVTAFKGLSAVAGLLGGAFTFLVGLPAKIIEVVAASNLAAGAAKVWTGVQWLLNAAMDANPIGIIIIAIAALVAGFVLLWTHSAAFRDFWIGLWHAVMAIVGTVVTFVREHWQLLVEILTGTLLVAVVVQHWQQIQHAVLSAVDAVVNFVKENWKQIVGWLADPMGMAVMEIRQHWGDIEKAFTAGWHAVMSALDGLRHDIAAAWDAVRHATAAAVDAQIHDIETAFDNIRHGIAAIVMAIPGDIRKAWDTVRHDAAALGADVLHVLETAWNSAVSATSKAIASVLAFFQKLPGQVISFLASLPGQMLSIGENVIKGLINGILNAAAAIPGIMAGLASDVASYFTNPLKLFSPSRLFFDHGYNIVQGAINGVKANAGNLLATMRGLGTGVGAQGIGSSLAAGAIAPAGGSSVHVTVPVTVQGGTSGVSPQYLQSLQATVQEAVLRHSQLNPTNGLTPAWGH